MKEYIKRFVHEEEGMETIEFVVILSIVAGLISIAAAIGVRVTSTGSKAQGKVEDGLNAIDGFLNGARPGG